MNLSGWQLWIAAALLLAGGELFHGAFVLLALALACVPAALTAALGGGPVLQIVVLALGLIAEIPLLKPLVVKRRHIATNADAIVGKRVRVLQAVKEHEDGVVLLTGEHWKARSLSGELAPGCDAQVVHRDGLCLLVVPTERSN